tara:strand:- start:1291 stop:1614 length:324 start_codon:yes stop_codon:yes gene_type:complete
MIEPLPKYTREWYRWKHSQNIPEFDGDDYQSDRDKPRLTRQVDAVRMYMEGKKNVTLRQIAKDLGYPESSISAQLRNLRKKRFGGRTVTREYVRLGLYNYTLEPEDA